MKQATFTQSCMAAIATLFLLFTNPANAINILKSAGSLESAYVEWENVSKASRYNVYYQLTGGEKTRIDNQLIRVYPDHMRADVLGLKAGNYTLTVEAVDENGKTIETQEIPSLEVKSHIREGFAFADGNIPGGYKMDGTVKDNARIIYVTDNDINNITLDVVTDKKGKITTCTGLGEILNAYGKSFDNRPLIIRVVGCITTNFNGLKDGIYINFLGAKVTQKFQNVTLEGVGDDATLYGFGITLKRTENIELRNLGIMLFGDDAVSLDTDNRYIWVHHIDFFYGKPGSDKDQVKGDGSIDIKYRSTDITISFNHFFDSGKVMGCGGATGESENLRITYHHNWFDHCDSRCARLHFVTAHLYNNYYDGVSVYGIGNTSNSAAFVENNYFREVKRPMMISGQGTDKYDETTGTYTLKGTFSGQEGGMTKAYNNIFVNEKTTLKLVYQTENSTQFDAYLVENRDEKVPETVKSVTGACSYSNFDTAAGMYESNPDKTEDVPEIVTTYAGRVGGGDFKWTFDNDVDDESHEVNTDLKNAVLNYKSKLVGYQQSGTTAIRPATITTDAPYTYYDALGRKVSARTKGFTIVSRGANTYKVLK